MVDIKWRRQDNRNEIIESGPPPVMPNKIGLLDVKALNGST